MPFTRRAADLYNAPATGRGNGPRRNHHGQEDRATCRLLFAASDEYAELTKTDAHTTPLIDVLWKRREPVMAKVQLLQRSELAGALWKRGELVNAEVQPLRISELVDVLGKRRELVRVEVQLMRQETLADALWKR